MFDMDDDVHDYLVLLPRVDWFPVKSGLPEASGLEEVLAEGLDAGLGHLVVRGGHQFGAQHLTAGGGKMFK